MWGLFGVISKFWKQSKTSKNAGNPKSNESAAISLLFCFFCVLAGLPLDPKFLKSDEKSPHGMADAFKWEGRSGEIVNLAPS